MNLILAALAVFIVIVIAEIWWRRQAAQDEFSRKFVHITVGSFVAFWPYFLSWNEIRLMSVAFLVVVAISHRLKIFQAIHSVQRPTWGEVYFALAVGALTLVTDDKAIYAAALLQMSLADGLAAVIGVRYGKANSYLVLGHRKSLAGTATFFITSISLLFCFSAGGHIALDPIAILSLGALASVLENIGVNGLDNLLVPLVVGWLLTRLS